MKKVHCPFCKRKPNEIPEYVQGATENEMSPEQYVQMDEGTYYPATDMFCCTSCFIKQGMPRKAELFMLFRIFNNYPAPPLYQWN